MNNEQYVPPMNLTIAQRNRMPIERINAQAAQHGTATARLALERPLDHTRLFTCPSLAPLAHTAVFAELSPAQQRRYNQLVGLLQNELICFFELEIGGPVLTSLLRNPLPAELATALRNFQTEEQQHTQMFRRLNQLATSQWYATSDYHIVRLPRLFLLLLRQMTARPRVFPLLLWLMLLMEERSLMMSKRYAALAAETVEPQFQAAYRAHAEDEIRHVQLDWHLLEAFYQRRPAWLRRLNVWLLTGVLTAFLFKPKRTNVRLIELLLAEFPDLETRRPQLLNAVAGLAENPGYRQMMYSPEATPISRALFDRLPEFAHLRRRLFAEGGSA
ncbi:MAG: diiron oxygenase [Acidobacteria bacterium]|nr:diiron oxygenase [Acidobacteriota bacterium]MBI3423603.1 diiron oxygenase [Acidobacteriota bacterium]